MEETCYPPPVRQRLERLILAFGVRAGERLLDIGTGPGVLLPYLRTLVGKPGRFWPLTFPLKWSAWPGKSPWPPGIWWSGPMRFESLLQTTALTGSSVLPLSSFLRSRTGRSGNGRVLKPGGELVIAHLMSRKELAAHHGTHHVVEKDLIPENPTMVKFFENAGLKEPEITNRPGRYLARGEKIG